MRSSAPTRNTSWGTPYLACFLVFSGLLYQFLYHLFGFLGRRVSRLVWRSAFVIEARAGSFERWKLAPGDLVEIKG